MHIGDGADIVEVDGDARGVACKPLLQQPLVHASLECMGVAVARVANVAGENAQVEQVQREGACEWANGEARRFLHGQIRRHTKGPARAAVSAAVGWVGGGGGGGGGGFLAAAAAAAWRTPFNLEFAGLAALHELLRLEPRKHRLAAREHHGDAPAAA